MIKVLIQQEQLVSYRVDIFNLISKYCDLTVVHKGPIISDKLVSFKQEIRKMYKLGPFSFQNLFGITKFYDVVITNANLRHLLNNLFLAFVPRKVKWITWGIGVSASYKEKFDKNKKYDFLRYLIFGKSDALIFYSSYPKKKYIDAGINPSKLFVAHNTYLNYSTFSQKRKHYIFIGSLNKGKGLMTLIKNYECALSYIGHNLPTLKIIGSGELEKVLKNYVNKKNLRQKIEFLGSILEKKRLNKILSKAIISISPNQAGLAVLHSMSCGAAFVTSKNATTGGEIFNINHKNNGVLLENLSELKNIIIDAYKNPSKYILMGKNAYKYYYDKRSSTIMVNSFKKAINYVLKKKNKY